jgi:phage shock protein E
MNQIIIDVREPSEYEAGHVVGAINIPPSQLTAGAPQLRAIPKDAPLVVYCRTGARSNVALHILKEQGFINITNGINQQQTEARFLMK